MIITIDLPLETLEALRTDAGTLGRPAEQVAAEYLSSLFALDEEIAINPALDELDSGKGGLFRSLQMKYRRVVPCDMKRHDPKQ